MWSLRAWRRRRFLSGARLPDAPWRGTLASLPVLSCLSERQAARLQSLVLLFLHEKAIVGVQGQSVDDHLRLRIAAQACLLILELGIEWYDGFQTVLVYPGGFVARHEYHDAAGVVHREVSALSGEAWDRGPVILSGDQVSGEDANDGVNLVIHEFAHKLDMLTGAANGLPPLHRDMRVADWAQSFETAYEDLNSRLDRGEDPPIDPYAAESPAEFFAVLSEVFFETPAVLKGCYPDVYVQMIAFYRQDPAQR